MRRLLLSAVAGALLSASSMLAGVTQSVLLPDVMPTFLNVNGTGPQSNGFVCTTGSGGVTPLFTYQDSSLITPNQDPIRLNAAGQPVNGSTAVSVYLQSSLYRFSLYAPGVGNSCNGTAVGALVKTVDGISGAAAFYSPATWVPSQTSPGFSISESGALGAHAVSQPTGAAWENMTVFNLSNPTSNGKQGLYVNTKLTSGSGTRESTGIWVDSYSLADNGGEVSGIHVIDTGAGDAASFFHLAAERPNGYALPCATCGFGVEIGVDHGDGMQIAVFDDVVDAVAYQGRALSINDFSSAGGFSDILIVPKSPGAGGSRYAIRTDNDTGTDPRFWTRLDTGQTFIKGDLDLHSTIQMNPSEGIFWNPAAVPQPYIEFNGSTNFLEMRSGTAGMRVVNQAGTATLFEVIDGSDGTGRVLLNNIGTTDSDGSLVSVNPLNSGRGSIQVVTAASAASRISMDVDAGTAAAAYISSDHTAGGTYLPFEIFTGGGVSYKARTSGTDRTCIYINGALRLLTLSGSNVTDGGACP